MAAAMLAVAGLAASAPADAAVNGAFRGDAYGANASGVAGPVAIGLGKISYIPCPCNGTKGQVRTATVNALSVGNVLRSGAVTGTVKAGKTATLASATNTGSVANLNLFNGRVTATGIKAVANVNATSSAITVNANGSQLVNLRIGNTVINAVPAPNTTINLPGIGQIILNSQTNTGNAQSRRLQVEMLVVRVTVANSFLPIGARVTIAHAAAGFTRTTFPVFLRGEAYVALANAQVGTAIRTRIGKQAFVSIPCEGTSGRTTTNNVTAINAGTSTGSNNVLDLDTGRSTAFGGLASGNPVARTTSEIASVNLLKVTGFPNGLIRATDLKALSETKLVNNALVRSTNGSRFGTIRIANLTLPVPIPPNYTITALRPLFGITIKLNEQIKPSATSSDRTVVNMIKVTVTNASLLGLSGLPVGGQIIVGHADSGITR